MRFTLNLPMAAGRFRAIPPDQYLEVARAGEAAGFDHISVPDNVIFPETISAPYPYSADGQRIWDADTPCMDPWVVIPAMAAVTTRIGFFTNVLKLAIREPILVAKTVSSAACLSGGRVALGVGLSWMPEEFRYLHQDMPSRGARVDEAIEVIRKLLAGAWSNTTDATTTSTGCRCRRRPRGRCRSTSVARQLRRCDVRRGSAMAGSP